MYKIAKENLSALFQLIAETRELYLPVKTAGQTNFAAWSEEADVALDALKTVKYDSSAADFKVRMEVQLDRVAYNRNKARIQELWEVQSGFDSVRAWCNNYAVPIQWVVSDEEQQHIAVLKMVQDGKVADNVVLHNATRYLETHTISILKDKTRIMNCFYAQIGESYRDAFEAFGMILVSRLKTNGI